VNEYIRIFEKLKEYGLEQYEGSISASQYITTFDVVRKYCTAPSRALDWGAGNGHFTYFLLKNGFDVTSFSVDNEVFILKQLNDAYRGKFTSVVDRQATRSLPFTDNQFDVITSIGVLEHVRETGGDEIESLNELHRVLKPGGIFICSHLPNKYSWIEFFTKRMKNKHHHEFKYTKNDITGMTAQSNLILVECKRYGIVPRLMFRHMQPPRVVVSIFNLADRILSFALSIFCQNYYFVAKKPL
jgi:ubiquinone/menaquinone biosynthesis C-methylase UbiE